jgi:hypothetical protein
MLRVLSLGLKYPRIAFTQALKRLPVNLRPLLGVPPTFNPKGLGLFLAGAIRRLRVTGDEAYEARARWLVAKLLDLRSLGYSGACWGYPFPWQSRAFYVPRWTPTIVNTSFCAHALLDAADALGDERCADLARSACTFVLNDLARTDGVCFSYTPIDRLAVHNASMLGAGLLARVGARTGEEELLDAARATARWHLAHQHESGAWWYAEPEYQHWIDSFHTGFVLEALRHVVRHADLAEGVEPLARGYAYFRERFFLADGTPRYFHDRTEPLDVHCPTQAMVTFAELGDVAATPELTASVVRWFLAKMRAPEGYFYFRLGRRRPNRIPYLRWGQAWAYHGLTRIELQLADLSRGKGRVPGRTRIEEYA